MKLKSRVAMAMVMLALSAGITASPQLANAQAARPLSNEESQLADGIAGEIATEVQRAVEALGPNANATSVREAVQRAVATVLNRRNASPVVAEAAMARASARLASLALSLPPGVAAAFSSAVTQAQKDVVSVADLARAQDAQPTAATQTAASTFASFWRAQNGVIQATLPTLPGQQTDNNTPVYVGGNG